MKKLLFYITLLSSAISFLICIVFLENISSEFFLVPLYPLLYGLLLGIVWPYMGDKNRSGRMTAGVFLIIQWLRCVLLPQMGSICGYFSTATRLVDSKAASTASWLALYELIITFLAVYLILRCSRQKERTHKQNLTDLRGRTFVYVVFVLFAAILYLWKGEGMYTFFLLETNTNRVSTSQLEINQMMREVIGYGLTYAVILMIYVCFKRYTGTGRSRYVYCALLIALLRICIISASSDGRLAVLYPIGAFALLLPRLFRSHSHLIVRSIFIVGVAILGFMTIYKVFHAFAYDSYSEAFRSGMEDFGLIEATGQIDAYFYGVRNIAKNLYVSRQINLPISKVMTDILRNTFGVHYLVKDSAHGTVELYNLYIYSGQLSSGHLFSSLAYGYVYFGAILAPLATVFNIWFASFLEKQLYKAKHIEVFYTLALVYVRMVYNVFACFPMGWNNASRKLVLGGLIIGGASLLKHKCGIRRNMPPIKEN